MKPKVYLETSVISYLTSWPSRDLIVAANQQITQEWWQVQEMNAPQNNVYERLQTFHY